MSKNHFLPFQINTIIWFFWFFYKMAAGCHFGCPKLTFDGITGHFRSIRNFFLNHKIAAGAHFGCPRLTFDHISGHFRSIRIFLLFFFYKMAAGCHFGCPKFTFDRISGHFRSIHNFIFFGNFWQNGCRRPFLMSEIHFRWHFWPF